MDKSNHCKLRILKILHHGKQQPHRGKSRIEKQRETKTNFVDWMRQIIHHLLACIHPFYFSVVHIVERYRTFLDLAVTPFCSFSLQNVKA